MCDLFLCDYESNIVNYADYTILYTCEPNMDLVLGKLGKDISTDFTWFQNNYLKADSGNFFLGISSNNVLDVNVGGNQLSICKYEKILGNFIDHKLTFEDHFSNIVQNVTQKALALEKISKYMPQKKVIITMKAFATLQFEYCPLT